LAVHRKHHAACETPEDPHSPVVHGVGKVLLQGAELYRAAATDPHLQEKYGRGTPDDWLERNLYVRHRRLGVTLMVLTDLVLFGVPGIIIIAVQMSANPLFAAGIINGLGHHAGYRNFESPDAARNIVPWGLLIAGEELHNNHHAFPSSAKFSIRRWELDIGWLYIRLLRALGMVRVIRVAPQLVKVAPRKHLDLEVLRDHRGPHACVAGVCISCHRAGVSRTARAQAGCAEPIESQAVGARPDGTERSGAGGSAEDSRRVSRAQNGVRIPRATASAMEQREREQRMAAGAFPGMSGAGRGSGIRALQQFAQGLRSYALKPG
jgi:hypothetical protein